MSSANSKIRVLVVDDSLVMRLSLRRLLEPEKDITIVGTAMNGEQALEMIEELRPDVVTLDVHMPKLDGIEVLRRLNSKARPAVIMVSSATHEGAQVTLEALELGAFDYIAKSDGLGPRFKHDLIDKIRLAANQAHPEEMAVPQPASWEKPRIVFRRDPRREVVVIGASTGGPRALTQVLSGLPEDFPLGILVVQHMPAVFTTAFAARLDKLSALKVVEAASGDTVLPGHAYLAPGGMQMVVRSSARGNLPVLQVVSDPAENHLYAPSVDVTMLSAVEAYQGPVLGVVLTGMGSDGKEGMTAVKRAGGVTIAQDRMTSVVYGMPRACAESGVVDIQLPLQKIHEAIIDVVGCHLEEVKWP
ncbi:MAG: chemotaxis response regulator protein-glutamate methylesterase [Calditrichaeota bacterium]|nr:chemotaxis response regulator protein-glutamate methylesterase [Calditrichota bacterium]